jgi:hypothetical protein
MSNDKDKPDYFQFRWGVKEWDVGFTTIPNPVLKYYAKVPWVDKEGKQGCGITNQEVLCIIHIASFHYESERGEARPAIPTIRKRMGYQKDGSVSRLIKSLEHKNLLIVERKSGKCNVYSLSNFSHAIVAMDNPPTGMGGAIAMGTIPVGEPIPVGDNPPPPVGTKNKNKNEKPKDEEKKAIISFPENSQSPSRSPFQKGDDQLVIAAKCEAERQKAGGNYAVPAQVGGSCALAESLIAAACARLGRSEPKGKKRGSARLFFEKALKTEGLLQGDIALLIGAVKDWLDPEGEYTFFLPQYDLNPKHELALRHFGIVLSKAKRQADHTQNRRAADIKTTEASLAALEERRAARALPPTSNEVGQAVKHILKNQVQPHLFRRYIEPASFICDDGTLLVAAPDANTRNWLKDHTNLRIRGILRGIEGPNKIVFEVAHHDKR